MDVRGLAEGILRLALRRSGRGLALTLMLSALPASGCADSRGGLSPSHSAAIADSVLAALAAYGRYSATAQWDSLVGLYGTDSSFRWIEGAERYHGATVRRTLMSMPPGTRAETKYDSTEVVALAPGLALLTTYYDTRMVGPMAAHFSGAISMLWSHEPGGWRVIGGHSSAATPHASR